MDPSGTVLYLWFTQNFKNPVHILFLWLFIFTALSSADFSTLLLTFSSLKIYLREPGLDCWLDCSSPPAAQNSLSIYWYPLNLLIHNCYLFSHKYISWLPLSWHLLYSVAVHLVHWLYILYINYYIYYHTVQHHLKFTFTWCNFIQL